MLNILVKALSMADLFLSSFSSSTLYPVRPMQTLSFKEMKRELSMMIGKKRRGKIVMMNG